MLRTGECLIFCFEQTSSRFIFVFVKYRLQLSEYTLLISVYGFLFHVSCQTSSSSFPFHSLNCSCFFSGNGTYNSFVHERSHWVDARPRIGSFLRRYFKLEVMKMPVILIYPVRNLRIIYFDFNK